MAETHDDVDWEFVWILCNVARDQAGLALLVGNDLSDLARSDGADFRVWASLQVFLSLCASVARMLGLIEPSLHRRQDRFGLIGAKAVRAALLGEMLAVDHANVSKDDLAALRDVSLRDALEHLDERLEDWWLTEDRDGPFVDMSHSTTRGEMSTSLAKLGESRILRHLEGDSLIVFYRGREYRVYSQLDAILSVNLDLAKAREAIERLAIEHRARRRADGPPKAPSP